MNSLRRRIAVILLVSIVFVVVLATYATVALLGPVPAPRDEATARQLVLIDGLISKASPAGQLQIVQEPAGVVDRARTEKVMGELASAGTPLDVRITHRDAEGEATAYLRLREGGWLVIPILAHRQGRQFRSSSRPGSCSSPSARAPSPCSPRTRVTRPLSVIEAAVAAVRPDGTLPPVPEIGSAEVRATANAINRLSQRLSDAMNSRIRMVAAAGHDLRTPLTRVRLRAEFLPEDERALWLKDLDELERIADSAIRLVREETEAAEMVPIALEDFVRTTVEDLVAQNYPVKLGRIEAVTVRGRPEALTRALRNVFINAATHGGGADIKHRIGGRRRRHPRPRRGAGHSARSSRARLRAVLPRRPGRRQRVPGTGLGLASPAKSWCAKAATSASTTAPKAASSRRSCCRALPEAQRRRRNSTGPRLTRTSPPMTRATATPNDGRSGSPRKTDRREHPEQRRHRGRALEPARRIGGEHREPQHIGERGDPDRLHRDRGERDRRRRPGDVFAEQERGGPEQDRRHDELIDEIFSGEIRASGVVLMSIVLAVQPAAASSTRPSPSRRDSLTEAAFEFITTTTPRKVTTRPIHCTGTKRSCGSSHWAASAPSAARCRTAPRPGSRRSIAGRYSKTANSAANTEPSKRPHFRVPSRTRRPAFGRRRATTSITNRRSPSAAPSG